MVSEMAHCLYEGLMGASVHEMRSVVTAMKLDVELLAADSASVPVIAKIAPRLSMSVAYLERLLDDVKEYTRVPKHDLATESLANLCDDALRMVVAELKSSGRDASPISVEWAVSPDLLVRVSRMPMVLALRNLIKNAHDAFMLDETRFESGTIRVSADCEEGGVRLSIADTGLGLSEDELHNVRQFIPGRSSKGKLGTGFGLPIARRNIQANGGDLRIESRLDEGTQVTVWLPNNGGKEP
jgi:signal transduction histidine kinase